MKERGDAALVRAGGGVIWRPASLSIEVAVVHRPHRDDWSWPKGKLESGETVEEAAVREVEEETGLRCRLGRTLGTVDYIDAKGRPKRVWYWEMKAPQGGFVAGFVANDEVDDLRWVSPPEAAALLDYAADRIVLGRLVTLLGREAGPGGGGGGRDGSGRGWAVGPAG